MSDGTIEEIKARLNIVECIGTYVRLEKAGVHYKACCPFHQERTPSFMVNEEKNMWHCFGCGKGGDVFAFVMEMEGLDFREALQLLAEKAGVELPKFAPAELGQKENKDRLFSLLELATKFYEKQLWDGSGKNKIVSYLRERGLNDESIKKFRLGYAPEGWRHLGEFLLDKGYTVSEMEQTGLLIKKEGHPARNDSQAKRSDSGGYDRFRDRIMFPIFDIFGHVIGYSARVAPGGDESQAKYINTPETILYHKSRALYGLFQAKQAMKQVAMTVIVEGNTDVIALHQAGVEHTVAVSGTALTEEQLNVIKRYGKEVRLFFDMDGAGQKAAKKSAELALEKELEVSIVALPFGKDAADMGKDDAEKLREVVAGATPALKYFLATSITKNDIATPSGKRQVVDEYTELLQVVKNPIERSEAIKDLARALHMDERMITGVVSKLFQEKVHRDGTASAHISARNVSQEKQTFGKRSELLREELVGMMYADTVVRKTLQELLINDEASEVATFLEKHPLYFFLIQAGAGEPIALIEDALLKTEALRLSFRVLELPDFIGVADEERTGKMLEVAKGYLLSLKEEIMKREKLIALEHALDEARAKKDKKLERDLLVAFVAVSSGEAIPPSNADNLSSSE